MDRHFRVMSSRHLFWDTMNNGTPIPQLYEGRLSPFLDSLKDTRNKHQPRAELALSRRVEADNAKCPEIYILGHWLAHCETKASLQFYLLGYRAHSSPGHIMGFKGNLYETPFETAR